MAKRCEICGKTPVVGRQISHAHNVSARRFEPNLQTVRAVINGGEQADSRLHPVPALQARSSKRGRESRLRSAQSALDAPKRSVPTRRPFAPASCCLSPARCRSIRPPAQIVGGDIARADAPGAREYRRGARRPADCSFADVVRTTVFLADMNDFAADERGLRDVLLRAVPGSGDRPGRAAAARRAHRDRRDRELRLARSGSAQLSVTTADLRLPIQPASCPSCPSRHPARPHTPSAT